MAHRTATLAIGDGVKKRLIVLGLLAGLMVVGGLLSFAGGTDQAPGNSATSETGADKTALAVTEKYEDYRSDFPEVPEVSPDSLAAWLADPATILVDVRKSSEREVSLIPGSITVDDFDAADFRQHRIIAYCTIGYRSGKYAEELRDDGLDAYNLAAGILGWVHAGHEVVHNGEPTQRVHVYGRQWNLLPEGFEPVW
ncbi:hypothetical protein DRQ53_12510 [bacterium]|nr:MAG: hypothetical protein DRQ53_12510 [bacterium]